MCGIFGCINFQLDTLVPKLALKHRGPDDSSVFKENNLVFVHTRLAIQDISLGKQPMTYKDYTIIYNGEIYNHMELRDKFYLKCISRSDTETIVHLYEKFKYSFLDYLDGMFAFCIYDKKEQKLFIARDRAGEKPFYLYNKNQQIIFASELNVFKKLLTLNIDYSSIYTYLRFGFSKSKTPYTDIEEIEAGTYAIIDIKNLMISKKKWWNILTYYNSPINDSLDEAKNNIDQKLHKAIQNRLESSDLEVGTFLSGGIDSGLITSISAFYKNKLKTFTVAFNGQFNESLLARKVAEKYNTEHIEIDINYSNLKNDIINILSNYGEPFSDSSAVPSYYVSMEAKKYLTVILNGDGADELFGGYRRYVPFSKISIFDEKNIIKWILRKLNFLNPTVHNKMSYTNYLSRFMHMTSKIHPWQIYFTASIDAYEGYENNLMEIKGSFNEIIDDINKYQNYDLSSLQKIMLLDFDFVLPGDFLVKMDIASMANSLETRSPFLGKDILEYAPRLSDGYKIRGLTTKYILRELAKKYLPFELINQPKRGFEAPIKQWVDNELKEVIFDTINNDTFILNFIKKEFFINLLQKKINISAEKRAKMIWKLFALSVWNKYV